MPFPTIKVTHKRLYTYYEKKLECKDVSPNGVNLHVCMSVPKQTKI